MNLEKNDIDNIINEIEQLKKKYKKLKKYNNKLSKIINARGKIGATGATGATGKEGPALFTLVSDNASYLVLTSNSITTTSNNTRIVSTVENYYTAFLTFILNSGTPIVGFLSKDFINTISFNFQFNNDNTYSIASNGGGQAGSYIYNNGDIFTIALTSSTCKYYQNGTMILSVNTNTAYLNVYARFYIENPTNISNISFGYLTETIIEG